jgi:hypothetical protein
MNVDYFLAPQEPAPQLPSPAGFFFFVDAAAGLAAGPAAGAAVSAGGAGEAGAAAAAGVAGVAGAAGDAGLLAAGFEGLAVPAAAGAAVEGLAPVAGEVGWGADPPHAATPSAVAAKPKILFRSVISIALPP